MTAAGLVFTSAGAMGVIVVCVALVIALLAYRMRGGVH